MFDFHVGGKKLMFLFKLAREKPKVVKGSNEANDGPEAKKPKVDPNETTMVKKVSLLVDLMSVNYIFQFSLISMTSQP